MTGGPSRPRSGRRRARFAPQDVAYRLTHPYARSQTSPFSDTDNLSVAALQGTETWNNNAFNQMQNATNLNIVTGFSNPGPAISYWVGSAAAGHYSGFTFNVGGSYFFTADIGVDVSGVIVNTYDPPFPALNINGRAMTFGDVVSANNPGFSPTVYYRRGYYSFVTHLNANQSVVVSFALVPSNAVAYNNMAVGMDIQVVGPLSTL